MFLGLCQVSRSVWARFHDVPVHLMTDAFAGVLARKISRKVVKVDGPVENYFRVRVSFPLDEPLKGQVQAKVKGHGELVFRVTNENVPTFCIGCGRNGHDEYTCPDGINAIMYRKSLAHS